MGKETNKKRAASISNDSQKINGSEPKLPANHASRIGRAHQDFKIQQSEHTKLLDEESSLWSKFSTFTFGWFDVVEWISVNGCRTLNLCFLRIMIIKTTSKRPTKNIFYVSVHPTALKILYSVLTCCISVEVLLKFISIDSYNGLKLSRRSGVKLGLN